MKPERAAPHGAEGAVSPLNKGLGAGPGTMNQALERGAIRGLGWNLLREDVSLPAAVLYEAKMEHNLRWMQRFIDAYGLKLAPHGKTTMAPALFQRQLEHGAWGITLATAQQVHAAYAHGVRRVLMANQLVGRENRAAIARLLRDAEFEFYCLVDSPENVEQLGQHFSPLGLRLNVLIELGVEGGRSGVRDEAQLAAVLDALVPWKGTLALCGVELYEGVLKEEDEIRAFLRRGAEVTRRLLGAQRFERTPALLSGAGSAWYDVVAEEFAAADLGDAVDVVLRPGCYLTHDVGAYREAQTRILAQNPIAREMHAGLEPALQVWAYVQSMPEAGKAIIAMGKRDAAFDSGLPVPALHYRPGDAAPRATPGHWSVTKMMDQHAFLAMHDEDDVHVGDMIGFDIAHPCLTFDKWRVLLVVDEKFDVVDAVQTYF
ncbi:MAG TPA: amino acid deaminase [Terracidiphilus sp.]|nr:amino acid deaminase [Terracidiphilus sp.]